MRESLTRSNLLSTVTGLHHGFVTNHDPDGRGREAYDCVAPGVSTVNQVHGCQLLWSDRAERRERKADAIATRKAGLAVGVYSADCTPILVAALDQRDRPRAVMAVHGGWRGTAERIAEKSLTAFAEHLGGPGKQHAFRYVAAIGPCISFARFEVGPEVVAAFPGAEERGLARFLRLEGDKKKFLFDLGGENARQIRETAAAIGLDITLEIIPHCTFSQSEIYPSYRRDGKKAGRILSFLSFDPFEG